MLVVIQITFGRVHTGVKVDFDSVASRVDKIDRPYRRHSIVTWLKKSGKTVSDVNKKLTFLICWKM